MFKILLAEDNKYTSRFMQIILEDDGYKVFCAGNGIEALEVIDKEHIDLIILDIMMPEMDGFEFTEQLRKSGNTTPILMVTAKESPQDKCKGFIVGTDDYMVKPVNEEEMLLRIKALLRRSQIVNERRLVVGNVVLEYDSLSVIINNEIHTLPKKEFYLLYKLLSYPNRIFTRIQLMDEIWGMDSTTIDTTINVHINRLRNRFENVDDFKIVSIRGVGYKAVTK